MIGSISGLAQVQLQKSGHPFTTLVACLLGDHGPYWPSAAAANCTDTAPGVVSAPLCHFKMRIFGVKNHMHPTMLVSQRNSS